MKLTAKAIGCALLTLVVTHALEAQAQTGANTTADTIYTGGDIITVNELQPQAEAIAVKDGRILAVGYRDEVMKYKGPETLLVDLAGNTLVPGFIDPHGHVFNTGIQAISANLLPRPDGGVNDIAQLQAALKAWAEQNQKLTAEYGWIVGFGYDDAQLKEQRHPTRDDLDQVSTTLPVVIVHQSGHLGAMNSKALEILGLDASTENPPGGVIRRKKGSQEPEGVLEENAFFSQLFSLMGKLSPDANKALFAAGVNTIQELWLHHGTGRQSIACLGGHHGSGGQQWQAGHRRSGVSRYYRGRGGNEGALAVTHLFRSFPPRRDQTHA